MCSLKSGVKMAINHTTIKEFDGWLTQIEEENLEFTTAKNSFNESKDLQFFLQFLHEGRQAFFLSGREVVLSAEVQIITQPLLIHPLQSAWNCPYL